MKLIVGLGNPGRPYRWTRHNLGFMVLDQLAKRNHIDLSKRKRDAIIGMGNLWGEEFILAKPLTYMNLSGLAVKRIVDDYGIQSQGVIVIHDDMDIEFGKIRIKERGGDGGHLGVRSIIESLGCGSFLRIRVGIGRPDKGKEIIDYLLSPFSKEEKSHLMGILDMAIEAIECVIVQGIERARTRFHAF
jgi:PTH1 family peptidyl-tRNA hydrolase